VAYVGKKAAWPDAISASGFRLAPLVFMGSGIAAPPKA